MTHLQLDWSTAEVSKGKLTVRLDDRPTDEWAASFERTAQLLDRGTWPSVKLKKREVTVEEIEPGSEERLRFFLESVIQEANAEQAPEDEAASDDGENPEDSAGEDGDAGSEANPDAEMTGRFRSFAPGAPGE